MANIRIDKSINGEHETSLSVPTFVLGIAKSLLPQSALSVMAGHGINVQEILDAKARGVAYTGTVEVREHGISKQIAVSLN